MKGFPYLGQRKCLSRPRRVDLSRPPALPQLSNGSDLLEGKTVGSPFTFQPTISHIWAQTLGLMCRLRKLYFLRTGGFVLIDRHDPACQPTLDSEKGTDPNDGTSETRGSNWASILPLLPRWYYTQYSLLLIAFKTTGSASLPHRAEASTNI